eukprot:scaffold34094_cov42-Attheya_sp.AAC.4
MASLGYLLPICVDRQVTGPLAYAMVVSLGLWEKNNLEDYCRLSTVEAERGAEQKNSLEERND